MSSKLGTPVYLLYVLQVPAYAQQHHFQLSGNAFFQKEPGQIDHDKALWSYSPLYLPKLKLYTHKEGRKQVLYKINITYGHFFGQKIHFQNQKLKIFVHGSLPFFHDPDYPANKSLYAGLIRQISYYLPDFIRQIRHYLPD